MTVGDIVVFKGEGFLFKVLSGILCLFDSEWRRREFKGWHVAFVSRFWDNHPIICEALAGGVTENFLETDRELKVYQWFDYPVDPHDFVDSHMGKKYDVAVYFHTMIQYLLLKGVEWFQKKFIPWHEFTISLPRILNDRYTCWENTFWFCRAMGKPIQESEGLSATRYPMITNLLRALENE